MLYRFIAVKTLSFTKNIALVSEVKSYRVFTLNPFSNWFG